MTYGRIYIKGTVKKEQLNYRADGTGRVNSDSNETGRSLSSNLAQNVDRTLQIAYEVQKRGDSRGT